MAEEPVMTAVAVKMNLNMVMDVLELLPLFSLRGSRRRSWRSSRSDTIGRVDDRIIGPAAKPKYEARLGICCFELNRTSYLPFFLKMTSSGIILLLFSSHRS